jgi:predicted HAD superfamily Cof-like phosphohydrolase
LINYCADVQEFQEKFGLAMPDVFTFIANDLFEFRVKFFIEEAKEYEESHANGDLPGAIDALIDLVYITCGCALFHGIKPVEFEQMVDSHTVNRDYLFSNLCSSAEPGGPHLLSQQNNRILTRTLNVNIDQFVDGWQRRSETDVRNALSALYLNALYGSYVMGFTNEQWDEFWMDVQRANLSKVRAQSAVDSKRGSTHDVIKPPGWVGPKTEELVTRFVDEFKETA